MELKHGFELVSKKMIEDIDSCLYEYKHVKSGATLVYLENNDTNCAFAIGFRTLPKDSTGVCHIIEHSLLCGSDKYPLKEPFVNLLKGSMATFLNAFTANDWTMYPFASQTPKDYDNILSVYLDAVFNPLSIKDPKPFLQEGWHLEMMNEDDMPSYKGVVYNEMKGSMSSVDRVLGQATLEAMYDGTCYAFNAGGDPDVIPSLTFEDYKAFYKEHYTPQNAMTLLYGKLNIDEKLEFIDREYFSKYEKTDHEIVVEEPKPVINLDYEKYYEIGPDEDTKDNTYMSLCYGLDKHSNYEDYVAWQVLITALLSKNDSPIKKALIDAKLGQNVVASLDDDNIRNSLQIALQKTNNNKKEAFRNVFLKAVKDLVDNGIDKNLLLATINNLEFKEKEMNVGSWPKGLIYAMNMMGNFNYRTSLTSRLEYTKIYEKLRKELNNGYFENLLDKYILNSNYYVQVLVKPSKTLGQEKKAKMEALMKDIKAKMSKEEIAACIKQTKELIAYQNHVDTKKELSALPKLSIKDIPSTINYLDFKKANIKGTKGIIHEVPTNKIAYLRMYFDEKVIKNEELGYCLLLSNLLGNLATKSYSAQELNSTVNTYLGDLKFSQLISSKEKDDCQIKFKVSVSALEENIGYISNIINEVLFKTKFTGKEVKIALLQLINELKNEIIGNGMAVAMNMVRATSSLEGAYTSKAFQGLEVYNFLNDIAANYDGKVVCAKLKEIVKTLFNKKNCLLSLSGDAETINKLTEEAKLIKLASKKPEETAEITEKESGSEALIIPSGVSYNALGSNLSSLGFETSGKLNVLTHIVNFDYLWTEIRVKGGAYGVRVQQYLNGDLCFGSYRDPNVKNTYEVFEGVAKYLREFKPTKDEFNTYLIGANGSFDTPLSTPVFIDVWDRFYITGITRKDRIALRKQMIHTKQEDIVSYAPLFEALASNSSRYTIGNDEKINEYQFDKKASLQ